MVNELSATFATRIYIYISLEKSGGHGLSKLLYLARIIYDSEEGRVPNQRLWRSARESLFRAPAVATAHNPRDASEFSPPPQLSLIYTKK